MWASEDDPWIANSTHSQACPMNSSWCIHRLQCCILKGVHCTNDSELGMGLLLSAPEDGGPIEEKGERSFDYRSLTIPLYKSYGTSVKPSGCIVFLIDDI
jgi:hypothetical protein